MILSCCLTVILYYSLHFSARQIKITKNSIFLPFLLKLIFHFYSHDLCSFFRLSATQPLSPRLHTKINIYIKGLLLEGKILVSRVCSLANTLERTSTPRGTWSIHACRRVLQKSKWIVSLLCKRQLVALHLPKQSDFQLTLCILFRYSNRQECINFICKHRIKTHTRSKLLHALSGTYNVKEEIRKDFWHWSESEPKRAFHFVVRFARMIFSTCGWLHLFTTRPNYKTTKQVWPGIY